MVSQQQPLLVSFSVKREMRHYSQSRSSYDNYGHYAPSTSKHLPLIPNSVISPMLTSTWLTNIFAHLAALNFALPDKSPDLGTPRFILTWQMRSLNQWKHPNIRCWLWKMVTVNAICTLTRCQSLYWERHTKFSLNPSYFITDATSKVDREGAQGHTDIVQRKDLNHLTAPTWAPTLTTSTCPLLFVLHVLCMFPSSSPWHWRNLISKSETHVREVLFWKVLNFRLLFQNSLYIFRYWIPKRFIFYSTEKNMVLVCMN